MCAYRIVIAFQGLADYPRSGGNWTIFLQYMLGLSSLGHDVFWLEMLRSSGERQDAARIETFWRRVGQSGFGGRAAILLYSREALDQDGNVRDPEAITAQGMELQRVRRIASSADFLWNFGSALKEPILGWFPCRVLVDLDPGHFHISAMTYHLNLRQHQRFLSVGTNLHLPDCEVPTLGVTWRPFRPFIHVPSWEVAPDPGPAAPFGSVTHWNWGELWLNGRRFSISKRESYLRYLELPVLAARPFELAARIDPDDQTGDRELLRTNGWRHVDPWQLADSPRRYKKYIAQSRAELSCPKPVYRELRSGWFSDRSVCYLASGRPVLAEDTGFQNHIPTGQGLLVFRDMAQALEGVAEIDRNYDSHSRAARRLAEEYFSSERCLSEMIAACG